MAAGHARRAPATETWSRSEARLSCPIGKAVLPRHLALSAHPGATAPPVGAVGRAVSCQGRPCAKPCDFTGSASEPVSGAEGSFPTRIGSCLTGVHLKLEFIAKPCARGICGSWAVTWPCHRHPWLSRLKHIPSTWARRTPAGPSRKLEGAPKPQALSSPGPSVHCARCSSFSVKRKGVLPQLCCLQGQHRSPTEGSRAFLLAANSARSTASFPLFLGRETLAACVLDLSRRRWAALRRRVHHQQGSLRGPRPRTQPVSSGLGCGPWSADSWLHVLFLKP